MFLVVVIAETVAGKVVSSVWSLGPVIPVVETNALSALFKIALIGGVWWFARKEGVGFDDVGLSTTLVGPAIVAVTAFYLALNVLGIGFAMLVAGPAAVGYQWFEPPAYAAAWFIEGLVLAAIVEELVFRGYIQSKVIAIVGSDTRSQIGVGIVIASVLFAAIHIPRILTSGVPGAQSLAGYGGILFLSGLMFGILYELTHNLYIPILLHAAGNMPGTIGIIFFDLGAFPAWANVVYLLMYLALVGIVIAGYRRWAFDTGKMPVWTTRSNKPDATLN